MALNISSLERSNLAESVSDLLRESIVNGQITPGTHLIEAEIAKQLNVSRGPLREAFRILEKEGLLDNRPGRGAYVSQPSERYITEAYSLRSILEVEAFRLAIKKRTEEDLDRLENALEELFNAAKSGDERDVLRLDIAFHRMIWGIADHRLIQASLEAIITRLPVTLELTLLSLAVAVALGVVLGVLAAVRPYTRLDVGISLLTAFGTAMPNFWIAILFILVFALYLRVLPSSGSIPFVEDPLGNLRAMVLPAITLSAAYFSNVARLTRAKMLEALESEYVRTARAKGVREARVLLVHALRNSLLPVLSVLGVSISRLFGGAVVTETIFALPGIGILLVDSILSRDFPVVQGVIIVITVGVFVTNFLIELAYAAVDPRVRIG